MSCMFFPDDEKNASEMRAVRIKMDTIFKYVFLLQWALVITITVVRSPLTWSGENSAIHMHIWAAFLLGGALSLGPIYQFYKSPGTTANMFLVTVCQMFYSTLIIHISGGRIESHFHIFGSLAILAGYRCYRALILASIITAAHHVIGGIYVPESMYGLTSVSYWRIVEHAAWVVFEDIFLIKMIRDQLDQMKIIADKKSELEQTINNVEALVKERTHELELSNAQIIKQQENMVQSAKLASLGEMAAGVAHEINNPLAVIASSAMYLKKLNDSNEVTKEELSESVEIIEGTVKKIHSIVLGMRNLSRDSSQEAPSKFAFGELYQDVMAVCEQRFKFAQVGLDLTDLRADKEKVLEFQRVQLSQVLVNLLGNAFDAVSANPEKWVKIELRDDSEKLMIKVIDSGTGIPEDVRIKLFQAFFTTKEIGKGTGLGLSVSKKILTQNGGDLVLEENTPNTTFTITVPYHQNRIAA